jgi:hypothetical protein
VFYRKEIKTNINRYEALIKSSVIYGDPGRSCSRECMRYIIMNSVLTEEETLDEFLYLFFFFLSILVDYDEQNDDDHSRQLKKEP